MAKERVTGNISLAIKGGRGEDPQSHFQADLSTSLPQHSQARWSVYPISCPHAMNPHDVERSSSPCDLSLAQDLPLNCLQATSQWGITEQSLLFLHLIYVSVNEWYTKDV